jgi:hypothetical protein
MVSFSKVFHVRACRCDYILCINTFGKLELPLVLLRRSSCSFHAVIFLNEDKDASKK